ncbi:hypothetical protein MLGJGCBP_05021 [Rhodococcus sp. T7]|nr:hypothetical protein MLGJGCBP_05021 [Rhodococcus sp. T7]
MGMHAAVWAAAAVSGACALAVAARMYETHPKPIRTSTQRAPKR